VSMLDKDEVSIALDGLKSGKQSMGHRILAPGSVKINSPESYVDDLRKVHVLVDPSERRSVIEAGVVKAAQEVSGRPRQMKGSLLDEVVNITEWPFPVRGEFEHEYLELPDTLIETVMVHHQRYFPVERQTSPEDNHKKLLPYFVSVANNDLPQAKEQIKRGN